KRFRQGRSVRNPQNGGSVQTSDHYVPAFKAGKEFKESVNKPKKAVRKKRK
ncbi:MAG: HU family DNA-binding protein, partial [Acidaminococcaceae bacterium]|nr:HU family DNA-binding protein [Acidaminococcaceae bacterium]